MNWKICRRDTGNRRNCRLRSGKVNDACKKAPKTGKIANETNKNGKFK